MNPLSPNKSKNSDLWTTQSKFLSFCVYYSVTRLGDFCKFLATNWLTKVAQIFWWLFGLILIMSLLCKKCVATFGAIFGEKLGNFLFHHQVSLILLIRLLDIYRRTWSGGLSLSSKQQISIRGVPDSFSSLLPRRRPSQTPRWRHLKVGLPDSELLAPRRSWSAENYNYFCFGKLAAYIYVSLFCQNCVTRSARIWIRDLLIMSILP